MATKLYAGYGFGQNEPLGVTRGSNSARLDGSTTNGWDTTLLRTTQGTDPSGTALTTATVAGPTSGVEAQDGATTLAQEYISPPLLAAATISGTITCNIWAAESNMSANVAINCIIERLDSQLGIVSTIAQTARTTEITNTVPPGAADNFTVSPTSTNLVKGDRIRLRIYGDDAGTMGSGFTFNVYVNRNAAGVLGDTWVQFTEDLTFFSVPSGSTLYLTSASAGIDPGSSTELEAWTSRGAGSTNSITNTSSGWLSPFQVTDTAGGTTLEWYSKQLTAFTLSGVAQFNLRGKESVVNTTNASFRAEVAVCASDGSGASVWGASGMTANEIDPTGTGSDIAHIAYVSGDDINVTNGQRLRFRVYLDDSALDAMVTGRTVTFTYNGTSAAASGDSYVILPQSVTEFVATSPSVFRERMNVVYL